MLLQDWNSGLLAFMRSPEGCLEDALEAISFMQAEWNVAYFCTMPSYDASRESVANFLIKRDLAFEKLKNAVPKSVSLLSGAAVELIPGLHECHQLNKLLLNTRKRILCVRLPLCCYRDEIDLELNRLLYKAKYRLLFASFELALILYPEDVIERLIRIRGAIYQFSYQSLGDPLARQTIRKLLQTKATVLLGSSVTAPQKLWHYELSYYLDCARSYFNETEQRQLFSPKTLSRL